MWRTRGRRHSPKIVTSVQDCDFLVWCCRHPVNLAGKHWIPTSVVQCPITIFIHCHLKIGIHSPL